MELCGASLNTSCSPSKRRQEMKDVTPAEANVLMGSEPLPDGTPIIRGHDFDGPSGLDDVMASMVTSGFQASNLGRAVQIVNKMLSARGAGTPPEAGNACPSPHAQGEPNGCKIFLGYTSNLISSGTRDVIRYLCQHRLVDVVVTTAGGIEEDLIKCLAPTYLGSFDLKGYDLRKRGQNRIGNLIVPNSNYCAFEEFMTSALDSMLDEQESKGTSWTPSLIIQRLGERIDDKASVYYWCAKNNIPVYCPALTDGSIGDMMFFHAVHRPGLRCDIIRDIAAMNNEALKCPTQTGAVILGGGLPKHHILNANLMRNGCNYCVLLNTAQEFDGSDSGARPDEAVSWGKIRLDGEAVKVCMDATIGFPLLVSQSFAKARMNREG